MTSDQLAVPSAQAPDAPPHPAGTTPSPPEVPRRRWRLPVALLVVVAVLLVGWQVVGRLGGDQLPAGVVAQVGTIDITQQELDAQKRLVLFQTTFSLVTNQGFQDAGLQLAPVQGDPAACAAWVRRYAPESVLGTTTDAQLAASCQKAADNLDADALDQVVSARIDEAVAPAIGATIDQSSYETRLDTLYASFGGKEKLAELASASGVTDADLRERLRQIQLNAAVEQAVRDKAGATTPSEDDLRDYYEANLDQFVTTPQKRDASVVVTANQAEAEEARQRVEGGESFAEVSKDLGSADSPKNGTAHDVTSTDLTGALGQVVFSATKGSLTGPTKVDDGWAVVRVEAITPQVVASFEASKATIEDRVTAVRADNAWSTFQEQTAAEWLPRITCASIYQAAAVCGG